MTKRLTIVLLALTCLYIPLQAVPLRPIKFEPTGVATTFDPRLVSLKKSDLPESSRYILEIALNNPIQISEKMKKEFWEGFKEYEPLNYAKKEFIRDKLIGAEVILTAYIYRDIMISIYLGEPYKSSIRKSYEDHLLQLRMINEINISEFEKLTKKMIEAEKSEKVGPDQPKKTKQGLLQLITKSSLREKRANQLFGLEKISEIKYPAPGPLINESQSTLFDNNSGGNE